MENKKGYINFITSEYHKNEVDIWYKANGMVHEKIELFRDFIISLLDLLNTTYLGKDVLNEEQDKKNHFLWCFNEIVSNFEKEKIYFKKDGHHKEYFWTFFQMVFYENENEDGFKKIRSYLSNILVYNYNKTKTDLEMLTEFYIILNQNLKK